MNSKGNYRDAPWLLFIFLPIGAATASLLNTKALWAKNIFWAFTVFYGVTFAIPKEELTRQDSTSDINRYVNNLSYLYERDELSFEDIKILYKENPSFDILDLSITIVLSRFTNSRQILTGVYALIYGFFLSRNLWTVFTRLSNQSNSPSTRFFILLLFLILPFWLINGFRFWTATQVFVYCAFSVFFKNRISGIFFSYLTVLIHFSFLIPCLVLTVYLFLRKSDSILFVLFLGTIIFNQLNVSVFNEFLEKNTSEKFLERTQGYRDEERVELHRKRELFEEDKTANLYAKYYSDSLIWSLRFLLLFSFFRIKNFIKDDPLVFSLFTFSLLFFSVANVLSSIPSGERWLIVACFFATTFFVFTRENIYASKKMNRFLLIASPAILLYMIVSIRIGFYSLSVNTFFGNPISALISDYNISLNDLIKPTR